MGIYGIDVSSYQAGNYPTTVQGHPVDFAFVKATEGTSYINPKQAAQVAFTRKNGDVLGFYHFLHSGNVKAQAAYFVEKCASVEGDILACDWEMSGVSGADKDAFLKEVKRLRPDHKVGLYCDANHWLNVDKTSYVGDFLWLANYNGSPTKTGVQHAVQIHQYTSTPVDTNYASAWGNKAAMKAWAAGSKTTPPPAKTPTTPPKETPVAFSVNQMADNYGTIYSLDEKDSKGNPVPHSGGYYLAHIHHDALAIHTQNITVAKLVTELSAKVDALSAQVKALTPKA